MRIAALEAALKPFADCGRSICNGRGESFDASAIMAGLTVGDFRRLAALLPPEVSRADT